MIILSHKRLRKSREKEHPRLPYNGTVMIHHWLKIVKQKIRAYWPIVAFTVPPHGRPQGPKNWASSGQKNTQSKLQKKCKLCCKKCKSSCTIMPQSMLTLQAVLQTVCKPNCNNVHNIG